MPNFLSRLIRHATFASFGEEAASVRHRTMKLSMNAFWGAAGSPALPAARREGGGGRVSLKVAKIEPASLQVVFHPARCTNNDVHPPPQCILLRLVRCASIHRQCGQIEGLPDVLKVRMYLQHATSRVVGGSSWQIQCQKSGKRLGSIKLQPAMDETALTPLQCIRQMLGIPHCAAQCAAP